MKLGAAAAAALLARQRLRGRHVDHHLRGLFGAPPDQMANIMFWLEGHYTEDDEPTTKLGPYIQHFPDRTLGFAPVRHDMTVAPTHPAEPESHVDTVAYH